MEDGTPLVSDAPSSYEPPTVAAPMPPNIPQASQPSYGAGPTQGGPGGSPGWQAPPSPQAALPARQRNILLWLLGGAALLVVGFIAVVVIIALVVSSRSFNQGPSISNLSPNVNRNSNLNSNSKSSSPERNSNSNTSVSNVDNANGNSYGGAGSNAGVAAVAPGDPDVVMMQLTTLEDVWSNANVKADKATLDNILADEYVGTAGDGTTQNKAQYLATIKPETRIKSWSFDGLKLSLNGNRAELAGFTTVRGQGLNARYKFTDTFVWRQARWQAISSQATRVQ